MPIRMRWRGLELPGRVIRDDAVSTDSYGRFLIEPFEQGFGTTIGNSLRRVLLSCLEGAAVTSVKIAGVSHEFTTIPGVLEDITDILLNIKGLVLKLTGADVKTVTVRRDKAGEVRAGDIVSDASVTVVNHDHKIATLTSDAPFHLEMTVRTGRGYATVNDNRAPEQELGVIPIDSIYSPILRVRYRTEAMRVGQRTDYDRLIMEVWTKGTILPEDALVEAGLILRKHLNPFVMYHDLGTDVVSSPRPTTSMAQAPGSVQMEMLNKSVSVLNLSARASNCLEAAKVNTLRDLVTKNESELLRVRSFGKTSLHEVQRKLADMGLSLEMKFAPDGTLMAPPPEIDHYSDDSTGDSGMMDQPDEARREGQMEVFTMGD